MSGYFDVHNPELWVGLAFFAFLGLMAYLKVPAMISSALDQRAQGIRKELDDARRLREEAETLLADYRRRQSEADNEAKAIIEQAQREAEALKAETQKNLKETLERRMRAAEDKIARAEAQAVAEVRAAAVDAAVGAAERVLRAKVTGAEASGLVEASIRDLKGRLN